MISSANEILIRSKRKVFTQNLGNNATTFVGNGMDFNELREYHYGDDVRKINHKATAKAQKPYINLFTEERELNVVLVLMISGNIYFGSRRSKQDMMSEVMALLGFSAMKNQDRVTTIFFSDKEEYFRPPTKNINLLNEVVPKALNFDSLKKMADYEKLNSYLLGRIKQKSIIFIIGDFYEKLDLSLLSAKHEIYSVVVRDRFEEDPIFGEEIDLVDPITLKESSFELDSGDISRYKESSRQKDNNLFEHFSSHNIGYTKIYTDEDPYFKIGAMVK